MRVKSVECNFNPGAKTYNPHIHLTVPDEATADILIEDWLYHLSAGFASPKAQSKLKVQNPETTLIEVVKYRSKIFTEPDAKRKNQYQKSDRNVYAAALDNIFAAMKGRRIFDRFGFNLPKTAVQKEGKSKVLNEHEEWVFDLKQNDWINPDIDEMLAGFIPTNELLNLLQNHIDKVCE